MPFDDGLRFNDEKSGAPILPAFCQGDPKQPILKTKGRPAKIVVHGYASREGAEARNMQLAGQRAGHVKEMLVTAGVPDDRIQVINHGPNSDWPGLKWNRRVEVEFQSQP